MNKKKKLSLKYFIPTGIIAIVLSAVILVSYFGSANVSGIVDYSRDWTSMPRGFAPLPKYNEDDPISHINVVLPEAKVASTIFVVDPNACIGFSGNRGLTENERVLLTSLQGIVAQDKAEIYIGSVNDRWIRYVSREYGLTLERRENLKELIEHYKDRLNGYVRANWENNNTYNTQINQASTLAGLDRLLIVAVRDNISGRNMISELESMGIYCKHDLTSGEYTEFDIIINNLDRLNRDFLMLQVPHHTYYLRDFGIALGAGFYFYDINHNEEETTRILQNMNPLATAFGWQEVIVDDELIGEIEDLTVERLSRHSMGLIPADFSENLSLWYSLPRHKFYQGEKDRIACNDENGDYHYVTLVYSDGDNIQCWQGMPFDT